MDDIIEIGDRIKFKAVCRYTHETVTRKVLGFYNGMPQVRYQGYSSFVVKHNEIKEIIKGEGK